MLFSGAAISLAAWGHWVPERSRPALLPACLPARLPPTGCLRIHLSVCVASCVSDYPSVSCVQLCVFFLPVCARVSEIEARAVPRGSGSRLRDSMADNRSSSGRLLGLVLSPAASSLSPLLAAPVRLSSQLNRLPLCHSPPATFFISIFPFAHAPSFSSSSPTCLPPNVLYIGWRKVQEKERLDVSPSC